MKSTIAEPVLTNPLEQFKPIVAEHTRKELAKLFPEQAASAEVDPLSKEELKALKEVVHAACEERLRVMLLSGAPAYFMLQVLSTAGAVCADMGVEGRVGSYRVEYAFQWARAYLFRNKLPTPSDYPADVFGALLYPARTCGYMNHKMSWVVHVPASRVLYLMEQGLPSALTALLPAVPNYTLTGSTGYEGVVKPTEVYGCNNIRGTVYTEAGTAWFAGFLNVDDVLNLRFRRMRLGAAVKELTKDDNLARKAADIRDLDAFDLVLHPNDRPFGKEYIRMRQEGIDLDSCMTHRAGEYDAPFDVHPCDVYSCAHYGQGDNGLVLVEAQQGGTPVGRGILNVHTKQIVRWYGEYKAGVMLRNTFGIDVDSDALDDVQLALIQDGIKIAAPYLDGCQSCDIEGGELYVRSRGDINMDDTSGYQWCEDREIDVLSGEYYPESDLEYQPIHETYYHPGNTNLGVFCPITEEYCNIYDTSYVVVDGEETRVSDVIYYGQISAPGSWDQLGGSIGWTQSSENYTYDDETDEWYTNEAYEQLVAEREAEQEEDKDEAA